MNDPHSWQAPATTVPSDAGQDPPPEQPQESQPQESLREQYADWPRKGDDRAQPWDAKAHGTDRHDLADGERNTISPILVSHRFPIVAVGSADPSVALLGRALGELGYPNSVAEGTNPFNIVDEGLLTAVERFREDYGVQEDPTPFGGSASAAREQAATLIGPYTWEAVLRVHARLDD